MAERETTPRKRASTRRRAAAEPAYGGDLAKAIVDTALDLAEETGWDAVRLHQVAERLGVPMSQILTHYRDLDAVADAWFQRAWASMLTPAPEGFAALPARERVYQATMRWFDGLAAHHRVSGEILRAKLYPSHPHHWVPLVFNLSRTVQWLREAALLDAAGPQRRMEEVGLTALFLATLADWLRDESPGQERTRESLRRRLGLADDLMARIWGGRPGRSDRAGAT